MSHKNSIALRKTSQSFLIMNQSVAGPVVGRISVCHLKVVSENNRRNFRAKRENR